MLKVYTDGGVLYNGKDDCKGSSSFIILENEEILYEYSSYVLDDGEICTNNRAELYGMINTMEYLLSEGLENEDIEIYSDSKYCVRGINEWVESWEAKDWYDSYNGRERPNSDLWKQMLVLSRQFSNIAFKWVKGHNKDTWNEYVDGLCSSLLKKLENETAK